MSKKYRLLAAAFMLALASVSILPKYDLMFGQYPQPGQALPASMGKTTLAAAITTSSATFVQLTTTSITVGPLTTVTSRNPQWSIAVDGEIMDVVNVSGNNVTVSRGQHGTVARVHASGQTVWAAPTNLFPNAKFRPMNVATRFRYETVPIGSVAYASFGNATTDTIALYCADLAIGGDFIATGIAVLNAGTVGTDKGLVALYDVTGTLVANSSLAGATTSGANAFQTRAFVPGTLYLPGGEYFACYQPNGTTDNFRTVAASTFVNVLTETVTAGTFGTIPSTIAVPTTFTANVGPIAYVY